MFTIKCYTDQGRCVIKAADSFTILVAIFEEVADRPRRLTPAELSSVYWFP